MPTAASRRTTRMAFDVVKSRVASARTATVSDCVPALPQLVAARVAQPERSPTPLVGAPPVVFTPGRDGLLLQHLWRLQGTTLVAAGGQARDADAGLGSKIVIVGNIVHDRVGRWPGPELLAWAIGDAIATPGTLRTTLLRRPLWALGAALLFSGVALAAFALLRRADPRGRHLGGVAVGSALAALALLALCVVGLRQGLQVAHYQVSYAVVGIVVATLLAWHARRSALLESALYTNVYDAPPGTSPAWDVFISYSHSPRQNIARVRRDLVEPLQRCSTADGPLKVFFDTSTIRIGTSWFTELAEGIERSRCFVAVYSDDYFRKSFCRFELRKAVVRDIIDQRRSFRVLPFKLDARADPLPEFSHLQFTEPENPGQMLQAVLQALRELGVHAA